MNRHHNSQNNLNNLNHNKFNRKKEQFNKKIFNEFSSIKIVKLSGSST